MAVAKNTIERMLVVAGVALVGRILHRRDVVVLAYHNIIGDACHKAADTSLHLPLRHFRRQLDEVGRTHDVVPLSSALDASPSRGRPRAVITFDDAYIGAVSLGVPELVRRGMPGAIFVAPGILGQFTWWDRLAEPHRGAVPPPLRDRAIVDFAGDAEAILAQPELSPRRSSLPEDFRIAREDELQAAAHCAGIAIGSHTWRHANLCALSPSEVKIELETSMAWLRNRFHSFTPWLSYPYGRHCTDAALSAERAGYSGAVRVEGGWLEATPAADPYLVPRLNVPAGLSLNGFRLRLGGIAAT